MLERSLEGAPPIVFIDDSHTFGGAQIALAWAIRAILQNTGYTVVCVCTKRTQAAVVDIAGNHNRLTFRPCPAALPLNLLAFPLRIVPFFQILRELQQQGVRAWWLNLSGLEFCLAPLAVLKVLGQGHCSWLHCTEAMSILVPSSNACKQAVNRVRDYVAARFLLKLHPALASPSRAASLILNRRSRRTLEFPHLYPTMSRRPGTANAVKTKSASIRGQVLWSIGRVQFGQKNNKAAVEAAKLLTERGVSVSLRIVGDGPDLGELRQYVRDLKTPIDVEFCGWKSDPWSEVEEDDIILMPSLWEGMPLVAIEAMLREIRIVTSPLPMFREGVPAEMIAADFSGKAIADQVDKVRSMTREQVKDLFSRDLPKFSERCFLEGLSTLLKQIDSPIFVDNSARRAQNNGELTHQVFPSQANRLRNSPSNSTV